MKTSPALSQQAEREQIFHDEWARSVKLEELLVDESFEAPTAMENQCVLKEFGDLRGKKLLDIGCGAGESSVYLASRGADVTACDISAEFLKVAQDLARRHKVTLTTVQVDSAQLPFPDGSFDLVYGNGVLHHVDLMPTCREISRVLKPGGKAAFIEPLPYNPIINLYRWMASKVRSADEKPLTFRQIFEMRPLFSKVTHEECWFLTLLLFADFFFIRRWHPSKVRYWKKVIEEGASYEKPFLRLKKWDAKLLAWFPFLRPLCWNTVIVAVK